MSSGSLDVTDGRVCGEALGDQAELLGLGSLGNVPLARCFGERRCAPPGGATDLALGLRRVMLLTFG
jgi:hypothetical protein